MTTYSWNSGILRTAACVAFITALALSFTPLHAQHAAWTNTYNNGYNDQAYDIIQVADGNYILAGGTDTTGNMQRNIYLLKINKNGDTLWEHTYGQEPTDQLAFSAHRTPGGGCIAVGRGMVRVDSIGNEIWFKTYSGRCVDIAHDGNFIVVGSKTTVTDGDNLNIFKVNAITGNIMWEYDYGGSENDNGYAIRKTSDGGYIAVGNSISADPNGNIYLLKLNGAGDSLWATNYGGDSMDVASDIRETSDYGFIIAGSSDSFGTTLWDAYLIKTDSTGLVQWSETYGTSHYDNGQAVKETAEGDFILTGSSDINGTGKDDLYIVKTNSSGDTLWTRTYGGSDADYGMGIIETGAGWYTAAGFTDTFGNKNIYAVRILPSPFIVVAYSPVNIIVEDPDLLRFGKEADGTLIDEISPADYFDLPHDSVVIYEPKPGTYTVYFVAEEGAPPDASFSAIIKVDGTYQATIIVNEEVPPAGEMASFSFEYDETYQYINGDANRDNIINVGDAVYIVNYIFKGGPPPFPVEAADANCDQIANIGDAVYIINFIFKGGEAPCAFAR